MHIYGKDQQAFHLTRTRMEKYLSRINAIIVAMQLACWLCSMIRVAMNASNSMRNPLFAVSNLQLTSVYTVPGCVYNVTRTHAFFNDVTYQLSAANVQYFVSRGVMNLRLIWALTGVYTMVSIVNRLFFESNTHELRYHFVVFRKDTLTTWEVLLMVMGIVMTFGINEENEIMQDYLVYCSNQPLLPKQYYNSVLPFVELYVMYFVSLGVFVVNLVIAVWNLSKENPRDALLKEDERRRQEWLALMEKYQREQQGGGNDTTNSNSGDNQVVTYASNIAPTGEAAQPHEESPAGDHHAPPPALRREPAVEPSPAPAMGGPSEASLYVSHLPSRARPSHSDGVVASPPQLPMSPPAQRPPPPPHHQQQQQQRPAGRDSVFSNPPPPPAGDVGNGGPGRPAPHVSPKYPMLSSVDSGRFELREVYEDDDDNDVYVRPENDLVDEPHPDSVDFSLDAPGYTRNTTDLVNMGDAGGGGSVPPQPRPTSPSVASTSLLAARSHAIPPPPPVAVSSSNGGGGHDSSHGGYPGGSGVLGGGGRSNKMLAPPSPITNGNNNDGDTTTDTVHL